MTSERILAYRKLVAGLLEAVLNDEIKARTGLNAWPTYVNEDRSVQCAYTMLWYLEADDERHFRESYYSDVQLQLLEHVVHCLKSGNPLEESLITKYHPHLAPPEYKGKWFWQKPLRTFFHQIQVCWAILKSNPLLQNSR